MAGRVLRSSNGRFNGSTKGFRGGLKKPSNSRFTKGRIDTYKRRQADGSYTVFSRSKTKGERALNGGLLAAGTFTAVGVLPSAGGFLLARSVNRSNAESSGRATALTKGASKSAAKRAIKATRAKNRLQYAQAGKNIKAGKKAKTTRKGRTMSNSIG